jgi:hypothetical protein
MKKQKRIWVKSGSARVDEDCQQAIINMLRKIAEIAFKMSAKELNQLKHEK